MTLSAFDFGPGFIWGAATSAYQIEGAWNMDHKSPSIWDAFTHRRRKVRNGENGDIACNSYNRYQDDVKLLAKMNCNAYRFSLAWSRILPDTPKLEINLKGIDYYNRLIDALLEKNIRPFVTLYHWDLPLSLEERGGWTNREIVDWFTDYAVVCQKKFGDRVKDWIILNEPFIFIVLGYLLGAHAPGKRRMKYFLAATHHALLAQANAARAMKAEQSESNLGTTVSAVGSYPDSERLKDIEAAKRHDALMNRLFVDPVFGRGYPMKELPVLKPMEKYFKAGDLENIEFPFQFLGLNNYTGKRVKQAGYIPWIRFREKPFEKKSFRTAMGWEVHSQAMYDLLKKFGMYERIPEIYITENGIALHDEIENGRVFDGERVKYLLNYLQQIFRAKAEKVNIKGYFVWSLMDNFEWAAGFRPRFGLAYVDFKTGQRTLKESAFWYRDFINGK